MDARLLALAALNKHGRNSGRVVAQGMDTASADNSAALGAAIASAIEKGYPVYIPAGIYVFTKPVTIPDATPEGAPLPTGATIEIVGSSDAFANSMNREKIGEEYHAKANGTTLIYRGEGAMFRHNGCVFSFRDLSLVSQDANKKYLYTSRLVGQIEVDSSTKGKIYAQNCLFAGWKTVAGDPYVTDELEAAIGDPDNPETLAETPEQCCIVASRCRFSFCGAALNMGVDSRLDDCAINKCYYGVSFYGNAGFSTIANTRIEWCAFDGVIAIGTHDTIITGCEFDRCGYASVRMIDCTNCSIVGNTMRRSGSYDKLETNDNTKNIHIFISGCNGGVISNNCTVKKNTSDAGTGKTRPTNAYNIEGCENMAISGNYLLGRNTGTYDNYANNTGCVVIGNVGLEPQ